MRILICIGGMPYSIPTVRFGGVVARLTRAAITVLNVVGSEEDLAPGKAALEKAVEMLPDSDAETKTRWGTPGEEILRESREGDYDLVIIGARDVLSLAELFVGSIARRAVRRIRASVLVVRRGRARLQRVLVCTGGRDRDLTVIEMGADLAQAANAQVTLLHVTGAVPSMYTGLEAMEERLAHLLRSDTPLARHLLLGAAMLEERGVSATLQLRQGAVASEILREAEQQGYDLIVIGASGVRRPARGLFMVDVTRQVVDRAMRPVLVVRPANV